MSKIKLLIKAIKLWIVGVILGGFFGHLSLFLMEDASNEVIRVLYNLPKTIPIKDPSLSIFLKNSIASLTIIFLGIFLCLLELWIYKGVAKETYAFLESLTSPLYKFLGIPFPLFSRLQPFYRSCFFYLNFIPIFAMLINGFIFGFLLIHHLATNLLKQYFISFFPHAMIEIPALFASAFLAFYIAEDLEDAIVEGNLDMFQKKGIKIIKNVFILSSALFIPLLLFTAAWFEAFY